MNPTPTTATPTSLGAAFWRIWAGQTVSTLGSATAGVGVAVYAFLHTGNAIWLGVLTACGGAPFVLLAPLLGRIDRYDRRSTMIAGDSIAAVGTVAALALATLGRLEVWHLVLAAFVAGVGTAIQVPAAQAAVPALVDGAQLDRANGLAQLGPAMGIVVGPAAATALVAHGGVAAVLIVDVITFVVALAATALTPFADGGAGNDGRGPGIDDGPGDGGRVGGWAPVGVWLRGPGRAIVVLLVVMATVNLCLGFFNVALMAMVASIDSARAGLPLAVGGLSMIIASVLVGRSGLPTRRATTIVASLAILAAGCAASGLQPSLVLVALGMATAMAAIPVLAAVSATVLHERVPPGMHGRLFALRGGLGRALDPIGAVTAGVVIALFTEPAMAAGGALDHSLGRLLGTGDGRGAALVALGVGGAVAAIATVTAATGALEPLDEPASADPRGSSAAVPVS